MKKVHIIKCLSLLFLLISAAQKSLSTPPALNNFGVSCYFNAVIQALNATEPLVEKLPELQFDIGSFPLKFKLLIEAIHTHPQKIDNALKDFYDAIIKELTKHIYISQTENLKKNIEEIIQQEDASEFLNLLIDSLKNKQTEKAVDEIFSYQEKVYFFKPDENAPFRDKTEPPNTLLSIPVFQEVIVDKQTERVPLKSIHTSLQEYFAEEKQDLTDENNPKKSVPTIIQHKINKLPKIFIIHLKRFYFQSNKIVVIKEGKEIEKEQGTTKKFRSSIEISLELDLKDFCTENVDLTEFELYATINHRGSEARAGHYVAYIKEGTTWNLCNDSTIRPVEFEIIKDEINSDGYILFYKKRTKPETDEEILKKQANHDQKRAMKEAVEKETERIQESIKKLRKKMEAKKRLEEESEALARKLQEEEYRIEQEITKQKQEDERKNLLEAQRLAAEQEKIDLLQREERARKRKAEERAEQEKLRLEKLERDLREAEMVRKRETEQELKRQKEQLAELQRQREAELKAQEEARKKEIQRKEDALRKAQETEHRKAEQRAQERAAQIQEYQKRLLNLLQKTKRSLQELLKALNAV